MFIVFVSEISAILGASNFKSSAQALEEIFERNKTVKFTEKFSNCFIKDSGRKLRSFNEDTIVTRDRLLVNGLCIRGRITVDENGFPIFMKRRSSKNSNRIFEEDTIAADFYSWLFQKKMTILEINVINTKTYVEKEIKIHEKNFKRDKKELIEKINEYIIVEDVVDDVVADVADVDVADIVDDVVDEVAEDDVAEDDVDDDDVDDEVAEDDVAEDDVDDDDVDDDDDKDDEDVDDDADEDDDDDDEDDDADEDDGDDDADEDAEDDKIIVNFVSI
jgi:hypothetical protein